MPGKKLRSFLHFLTGGSRKDESFRRYLRKTLGFAPKNIELFSEALRHKSVLNASDQTPSNERLEFLGDAVIELIIRNYLIQRFPDKSEGELSEIRARIVNREFLNSLGQDIGLEAFLEIDANNKQNIIKESPSVFGNALEAFTGAIFIESGYDGARKFFIRKVLEPFGNPEKVMFEVTDYKSLLIEWSQKYNQDIEFQVVNKNSRDDEFEVALLINGSRTTTGRHRKKKRAENRAARKAYNGGYFS